MTHDDSGFYLTLPSDACMEKFTLNNAASWTTKLRNAINLKGKWEMCLSEIQYMQSMLTLPKAQTFQCDMLSSHPTDAEPTKPLDFVTHLVTIPPGKYTADELIKQLTEKCPTSMGHPCYKVGFVSENDRRVEFTFPGILANIEITEDSELLFSILGFADGKYFLKNSAKTWSTDLDKAIEADPGFLKIFNWDYNRKMTAQRLINLKTGNQSMFVYCDVADYSYLGDTLSQNLRTVSIRGDHLEVVTERFDLGHYVPVLLTNFENITINLANDSGDLIKFYAGKSMVKLHFRRHRPY